MKDKIELCSLSDHVLAVIDNALVYFTRVPSICLMTISVSFSARYKNLEFISGLTMLTKQVKTARKIIKT